MTETLLSSTASAKTVLEIDLAAIGKNIITIKGIIGHNTKILMPVKADGYGHGAVYVSRYIESRGLVDMLGVASVEEGIELRESGIKLPILILGLILPCKKDINNIIEYDLTQTVADLYLAQDISKIAEKKKKNAKVHLKIDTGMGRIGCSIEEAVTIAEAITQLPYIELEGIFSHFPVSGDRNSDFTVNQINRFKQILEQLKEKEIKIQYKHLANSAAILNFPESYLNMVRPGIMAYGYMPSKEYNKNITVIPSMKLKSYIVFLKRVTKGTPLSYELTYQTEEDSNIATIPVGYGSGYSRLLSNKGRVIIRDKIYPIVGRVCMDHFLINIGDDEYPLGEEVILLDQKDITVETVADWIEAIPYEVTCSVSKRLHREYVY